MSILQTSAADPQFLDLVRLVVAETKIDEATAKASIWRLSSAGEVEVALDWSVHLLPAESVAGSQTEEARVAA